MPSNPFDSTHNRTTFGMQCNNIRLTIHTVGQRIAWHVIIAIGKHTQSDDVSLGISSLPMYYTNGWTMWGETWLNRPWTTHTVRQCRPWNFIIALGPPTQSNKVKAWHACVALGPNMQSNDVKHGTQSLLLYNTQGWTILGLACHHISLKAHVIIHRPMTSHIDGLCREWHAIKALGHHTRLDYVVLCLPSSPLDKIHCRITSGVAC